MNILFKITSYFILTLFFIGLTFLLIMGWVFWKYGQKLPDYYQLTTYNPPVVSRIHANNGALLAEFAKEKRIFVPISSIPPLVVEAFLSAEDKEFFNHIGIDFKALTRALITNIKNINSGRRAIGASTITQQIAKNFLLSSDYSFERKIKEAILSLRIERAFSKEYILELYLNEIYLGFGSYGIAAASLNYFNKALNELNLTEAAYLAALPKAPNNYHPKRKKREAIIRRNWVLKEMFENGYITSEELRSASSKDLVLIQTTGYDEAEAPYLVEEVRRKLLLKYGENKLYSDGLSVQTTLNPKLQNLADRSLRKGLESLDRRQGWRGPLTKKMQGESVEAGGSGARLDFPRINQEHMHSCLAAAQEI